MINTIFYHYKKYFILCVLLLVAFYILYKLTYSVRNKNKIFEFENTFSDYTTKNQLNYCNSNKYNTTKVADFYVCSSYNPMSIGYLKYDYVSVDMIQKAITYGSRYIELEIMDYELKNITKPVIGISNEEGYATNSQNVLDCDEVFQRINNVAFSERYVDNYQDPLFIFLNIKTKNTDTLDQLYSIITNILQHKLLDETYNYQKINIATSKICELVDKIVILSSDGYQNSKLEKIINLSTTNTYLRRLKWDELPNVDNSIDTPIVSLISQNISFYENNIMIDDNTNFLSMGVIPNTIISIKGSKNPTNNSYDNLLHIKQVTPNRIILDTNINFTQESKGSNITLKVFSSDYTLKDLHNQNKSSLTIVYTQRDFFNFNYDPSTAWNIGCQFVCMNFQKEDFNLKKYMKEFKTQSYILKPSNLRNITPKPIILSLNQQFPKIITENNIPILQNFEKLYPPNNSIQIKPFSKIPNKVFIIVNNDGKKLPKLSLNKDSSNSKFNFIHKADDKYNTIQIKNGNNVLTSNSSCCYLTFKPDNKGNDLMKYSSFYPVQALCNNDKYVSFLQIINNKKYYLKYRPLFSSKNRLYKKIEYEYNTIGIINNYMIIEPKLSDDFKSIGHVIIDSTNNLIETEFQNIFDELNDTSSSTTKNPTTTPLSQSSYSKIHKLLLLKGAVSSPIDFELMWISPDKKIYLWNPVSPDGFISLGVVFTLSEDKPDKNKFCCVATEFLTETEYDGPINIDNTNPLYLWSPKKSNNSKVYNFTYYKASIIESKPSMFIYPIYNFIFDSKDNLDLLYIGKVESNELDSACFELTKLNTNINILPIVPNIFYKELENKIMSTGYKNKCISLKNSYWSKLNDNINSQLVLKDCKNNDYWPNTFLYKNNSLKLRKNPNLCLENSKDSLIISKCNKSENQLFKYQNDYIINNKKCLTYKNKLLQFNTCDFVSDKGDKYQKWSINQDFILSCLNINDIVYLKILYPRAKETTNNNKNNNSIYNYLNESIDETYFHVYVECIIQNQDDKNWIVKLTHSPKPVNISKNKNLLISANSINNKNIKKGTKILAKNGDITFSEHNTIMWEAVVNEVLENDNLEVIFSINSIEANENKMDMGRPRINTKKIVNKENVIVLEPGINCK